MRHYRVIDILTPWIWKGVSATLQSGRYTLSCPVWRWGSVGARKHTRVFGLIFLLPILWNSMTLTSSSWLIQWSMGEGSYINLFSRSDVTAFHRIHHGWQIGAYEDRSMHGNIRVFLALLSRWLYIMSDRCRSAVSHPSASGKHETLNQCWLDAGPSPTQH